MDDRLESEDRKLLKKMRAQFRQAFAAEKDWRLDAKTAQEFYDGDQLSKEEKEELEKRKQPQVVFNRIKPRIDAVVGIHRGAQVRTKAFPRGRTDQKKAEIISEAFRYIGQNTNFELVESRAFQRALIKGRAWYEHLRVFDGLEVEFKTVAADPADIFLDPYCKQEDLSDAKFISKSIWMDIEDAKELWPSYAEQLDNIVNDSPDTLRKELREVDPDQYSEPGGEVPHDEDLFLDKERKRIRIVSHWWKTPKKKTFGYAPGEDPVETTDLKASELRRLRKAVPNLIEYDEIFYRVHNATFTKDLILEQKKDTRVDEKFPFVLVPCYVEDNEKRRPYGLVRQYMDPQKEVNKRRSKMLHLLNVSQVITEKGAVDDIIKLRQELARPDGVLMPNPGFRFEVDRQSDLAQAHFQLLQESKNEIDQAGIQAEAYGKQTNAESGVAIQLRQNASSSILRPLLDNLRQARKRLAELWLSDMQEHWTTEKLIRITDDNGITQEIILNERVIDPVSGEIQILNDVRLGKFDIIVEEAPDTLNQFSEQLQGLIQLASSGLPFPPQVAMVIMEMFLESSPMPNKERLLQAYRQAVAQAEQQQQAAQQAAMAQQMAGQIPQQV